MIVLLGDSITEFGALDGGWQQQMIRDYIRRVGAFKTSYVRGVVLLGWIGVTGEPGRLLVMMGVVTGVMMGAAHVSQALAGLEMFWGCCCLDVMVAMFPVGFGPGPPLLSPPPRPYHWPSAPPLSPHNPSAPPPYPSPPLIPPPCPLPRHSCVQADVINRGFGGYNSRWGTFLVDEIIKSFGGGRIKLVTIGFGANDAVSPDSS